MPKITPILLTFPGSVDVNLKLQGLQAAMAVAQEWFRQRLDGQSFEFDAPLAKQSVSPLSAYAPTVGDPHRPWGTALGNAGFSWSADQFYAIFVDAAPYTWTGFGGASTGADQKCGAVVKDGDCVNIWAAGPTHALWNNNMGMLCHELGHMLNANSHENPDGNNIEWEWTQWPNCVIHEPNRLYLRDQHRVIVPVAEPAPPPPPPPPTGPTYAQGVIDGRAAQKADDVALVTALLADMQG